MKFYDREAELAILEKNRHLSDKHSVMTSMMGRRRVGKTSLLLKSVEGRPMLYLYVPRESELLVCRKFQQQAESALGIPFLGEASSFAQLFEHLMKWGESHQYTLIIDEFQNFLSINHSIPSYMQDIWDRHKDNSHVNLILCGSIYSMMKKMFDNGDAPLYGRRDSCIKLMPFGVDTLKTILADHNANYQPDDLLCLYMLTGGVAKYVSLLMDAGATTKSEMLDFALAPDSPFLSEGTEMLVSEFGRDYGIYFSVLQLIAGGMTTQPEIDSVIGKNTGAYLNNLTNDYTFIRRNTPMFSKIGARNIKWQITDPFIRFWFNYVYRYQNLIESHQLPLLRRYVEETYSDFTGKTLEAYFRDKMVQSGNFTQVGGWWDRKGENEIDLIALNDFDKTGVVAEIKRNKRKINPAELSRKIDALPSDFKAYKLVPVMLSLEDM